MKLSVIIVNYNVKYFLEQALRSVRKASQGIAVEVWVVDNNSVDDSVPMVTEKFPEVRLIINRQNVGFAAANNQAIRQCSGEYLLLLNPDTVVEEDTFRKCISFMDAHPEAGGLGVRMIDGAGKFLPESKRGFPSPWVAFCKTFGLSAIFPRSPLFNRYHLGYLSEDATSEVDVLSGAFMWLRRRVMDEIGLLDEAFFMYGEDIDLSYRIIQGGFRNYYFPETTIIHYKGESTRKGSLNYVRTFYQAMIIFARKHSHGRRAWLFIQMLQAAIYFRAGLTMAAGFFRRAYLPILDAALIFGGLVFLKNFWANYHFRNPAYYDELVLYFNFPLYTLIWVAGVFFSGGYDQGGGLRRLIRGLLVGTLFLAAVYGFLSMEYRSSRALILLGAAWALAGTVALRFFLHVIRYGNLGLDRTRQPNLLIVGSEPESRRVLSLLHQSGVQKNFIGIVTPHLRHESAICLGELDQLAEIVQIYRIEEIIFCLKDVATQEIMYWMSRLGPVIDYKTVPEESLSIIGSHSRDSAGELYTIDIRFAVDSPVSRRNKRVLDLILSLGLLLSLPLQLLWVRHRIGLVRNIGLVLAGRRTWVGYSPQGMQATNLPKLRPGILHPEDGLKVRGLNPATLERLNFLYAKDYMVNKDLEVFLYGIRYLGRSG